MQPAAPGSGVIGKLARRGRLPIGYYKDPEKTAATFVTIGGERWVIPGDLGDPRRGRADHRLRARRRVHQQRRREDLPEEVEAALKGASRRARRGRRRCARTRNGASASPPWCNRARARTSRCGSLEAHCRSRIAGYKIPRQLSLVEEMVRHPSGKPDYRWAAETARARARVEESMYIDYTDAEKALVQELRAYFKELVTEELFAEIGGTEGGGPLYTRASRKMGADGWLGIGWPKEFGGQGRSAIEQYIFFDEVQRAGFPIPFLTLCTVGPTLMKNGTEEQKAKFLPAILRGELHFAIGYSEPSAGTDLAALRTRAVREGDDYVVNGQKVFTSLAEYADYIWLAVRTDPDAPRHKGISVLMVDTKSAGFSLSPIHTLGGNRTNATFYENVRVPVSARVGRENEGWKLITTQLNHERVALSAPGPTARFIEETSAWARETRTSDGARIVDLPWVQAKPRASPGPRRGAAAAHVAAGVEHRPGQDRPGRVLGGEGLRQRVVHAHLPVASGGARAGGIPEGGLARCPPARAHGALLPVGARPIRSAAAPTKCSATSSRRPASGCRGPRR